MGAYNLNKASQKLVFFLLILKLVNEMVSSSVIICNVMKMFLQKICYGNVTLHIEPLFISLFYGERSDLNPKYDRDDPIWIPHILDFFVHNVDMVPLTPHCCV